MGPYRKPEPDEDEQIVTGTFSRSIWQSVGLEAPVTNEQSAVDATTEKVPLPGEGLKGGDLERWVTLGRRVRRKLKKAGSKSLKRDTPRRPAKRGG